MLLDRIAMALVGVRASRWCPGPLGRCLAPELAPLTPNQVLKAAVTEANGVRIKELLDELRVHKAAPYMMQCMGLHVSSTVKTRLHFTAGAKDIT